ncbi:hypothetical protein DUNSADRAFT_11397 [Dunaliella salina]|uniref:Phosphohistidine phosphatase n=2 Tax=Dunaliella salina TaxID=3046 RepID=A0ABQ7GDH6_DUNSA|nr:hypothetical protein DUNSADRAFT_11397 [Dunaliella salina]|eukprot:KAF5832652.1 hypothetical protein DUNSADRAFT_11397 [Dunaliella salina]
MLTGKPWTGSAVASRSQRLAQTPSVHVRTKHAAKASSATIQPANPGTTGSKEGAPTRKLIVLRHADSAFPQGTRDHERPISAEGKLQAISIAHELKKAGWEPDLVLASNSKRTKQTLHEMSKVMESLEDVDTHLMGSLYTVAALDGQTRQHMQECMKEVVHDKSHFCVMLVGHNKGWEEAASQLAGQAVKLQTASAALLQVTAESWADVLQGEDARWRLVGILEALGPQRQPSV